MIKERRLFFTIAVLFVLSGSSALIYQIVWFKQLSYFLGSSTYSQSVVLATFMGGLAIGSFYLGKIADKVKNPLKIFAVLEIGIAVYCFFYKYIFDFVENIFTSFISNSEIAIDNPKILFFKILASFFSIIIPAILMGGTLPILVRFTSKEIADVGKNVTLFYILNSLGAILGTIIGGFFLIEYFGLNNSIFIAASIELIAGIISLFLSLQLLPASKGKLITKSESPEIQSKDFQNLNDGYIIYFLVLISVISGFCSMLYEIVWLRLLIPILSSTTFTFTLILAVFISGITLGSIIVYFILPKIKNSMRIIAVSQLGIVIAIFLTLPLYERIPYLIWKIIGDNSLESGDYSFYLFLQILFASIIIILPTVSIGITLPIVNKLAVNTVSETGKKVGLIFSVNTIGTVLGSLVTGLIFIPYIGITNTMYFGLSLNFLLGISILLRFYKANKRNTLTWVLATIFSIVFFFLNHGTSRWGVAIMTSEVPRKINRVNSPNSYNDFLIYGRENQKILFYKEGLSGTIVVANSYNETYLFTNGKGDANSVGDLPTQVSLAQIPMIIHPNPDNVFVIGYGAGTTIGNVLVHKNVKSATVAEISPEVIEASKYFEHINQKPLKDKRLKVIKDDGVAALRLSKNKYDLIISQPSNPWSAGVGNLFTTDFFQDCKSKLKPNGIVAQWFSLYEMDDKSLKLIIRTVQHVFENIEFWQIGSNDILMLCSATKIDYNLDIMKKRFDEVQPIMEQIDIRSFPVFLSQQFSQNSTRINLYSGQGDLNTEDFPLLEHWAPKAYFYNSTPKEFFAIDERNSFSNKSDLLLSELEKESPLLEEEIKQIANYHYYYGNQSLAFYYALKKPEIILNWVEFERKNKNLQKAQSLLNSNENLLKDNQYFYMLKAKIFEETGNLSLAISTFEPYFKLHPNDEDLYYERGILFIKNKQYLEAKLDFRKSIELNPNKIEAYNNLATLLAQEGLHNEAIAILSQGLKFDPKNVNLLFNRGVTYGFINQFEKCIQDLSIVLQKDKLNSQAWFLRGKCYHELGLNMKACNDWNEAANLGFVKANQLLGQFCNK